MIADAQKPETAAGTNKPAAPDTLPRLADKRAIGAMLGFSLRHVDNLLTLGCPHMKFGARRVRFDPVEVLAWAKQQFGIQRLGKLKCGGPK